MIDLYEVTVFCDDSGRHGDKHGIVIDESRAITTNQRLKLAAQLGYAETVYINDVKQAAISFFAQTEEIPFAGTAALAAAGMIRELTGSDPSHLLSQGNTIPVEIKDGLIWVTADVSIMPPWNIRRVDSVLKIDRMSAAEAQQFEHTLLWAWLDESSGSIRARTFAKDWLIPEAEANGSGSMLLATQIGRPIVVRHGLGSIIFAEPITPHHVKLGGRVVASRTPTRQLEDV